MTGCKTLLDCCLSVESLVILWKKFIIGHRLGTPPPLDTQDISSLGKARASGNWAENTLNETVFPNIFPLDSRGAKKSLVEKNPRGKQSEIIKQLGMIIPNVKRQTRHFNIRCRFSQSLRNFLKFRRTVQSMLFVHFSSIVLFAQRQKE